MALLTVEDLHVAYGTAKRDVTDVVRGVSFALDAGDFVGLLGESGCGKSTLGNAILRLLPSSGRITGGRVMFDGNDITQVPESQLRGIRWRRMSTVFQSSMNSLNPVMTVERQFRDVLVRDGLSDDRMRGRIAQLLETVSIDPAFMRFYPHELSGGMKQRVALALALALDPDLVVLDEPTTGLDVVVQRAILDNVRRLQAEKSFAVLLVSHDLGTVMEICQRVMVMYAGEIVETQPARAMLRHPIHPYTRGLLGSYADPRAETVDITSIPGRPPVLTRPITGCPFTPRCPDAIERCAQEKPQLVPLGAGLAACHVAEAHERAEAGVGEAVDTALGDAIAVGAVTQQSFTRAASSAVAGGEEILTASDLSKRYVTRRGLSHSTVQAVDDVSFTLRRGTVTALVGQSGSGKTTIARMVTGIERPDAGAITFDGGAVDRLRGRALRAYRKHVQMVFQDPFSALNPTRTVLYAVQRPLRNHLGVAASEASDRVEALLDTVGLSPPGQFVHKLPHQLSGGQRQRVVVARALAPDPDVIVADEPVSMLDVSIRAEILELLDDLVRTRRLAMLYITHDLLSARLVADDILVLNKGRVVEDGRALDVIRQAQHDYTRLLLRSIPDPWASASEPEGGDPTAAGHAGEAEQAAM